jgi:hypothetical protein
MASDATRWRRFCTLILAPLTDESGSGWGVVVGLATLGVVGTTLGLLLPQNPHLRVRSTVPSAVRSDTHTFRAGAFRFIHKLCRITRVNQHRV